MVFQSASSSTFKEGFANNSSSGNQYQPWTFVIVMKSGPKNTDFTPSTLNRSFAKGECPADDKFGKSKVPEDKTYERPTCCDCICLTNDIPNLDTRNEL